MRHSAPHLYHVAVVDSVWALPFSLAATSGISYLISLPRPTQMLHFGQFALPSVKQGSVKRDLIRKSRDQRSLAPTPGLSQLATSFITYQAESFPNRRLCTIPGTSFLLLQPRKFYANISVKPHIPLCQLTLWRVSVILCTTVIAGVSLLRPSLHIFIWSCMISATRTSVRTLYTKVVRTVKLRR